MIRTILQSKIYLLAFSLLLVVACNEKETKVQEEPEPRKPPGQIISEAKATVLYDTYSSNRVPCIDEFENAMLEEGQERHVVTRYSAFDYKVIQDYMEYIEEQATLAGVEIESLRIYFATYPEGSEKDPNKNTVFLVPTTKFGQVNKAFKITEKDGKAVAESIPWNFKRNGGGAMHQEQDEGVKSQASFFPVITTNAVLQNGDKSLILNDGNSSPPPPNQ